MRITFYILLCCISMQCYAQQTGEVIVTERGDTITMSAVPQRRVNISNTNAKVVMPVGHTRPLLLNGIKIYRFEDDTTEYEWGGFDEQYKQMIEHHNQFKSMLHDATQNVRKQLPDGDYIVEMKNMVVDENGIVVYYETEGLKKYKPGPNPHARFFTLPTPEAQSEMIKDILARTIIGSKLTHYSPKGKAIPYLTSYNYYFEQDWERQEKLEAENKTPVIFVK